MVPETKQRNPAPISQNNFCFQFEPIHRFRYRTIDLPGSDIIGPAQCFLSEADPHRFQLIPMCLYPGHGLLPGIGNNLPAHFVPIFGFFFSLPGHHSNFRQMEIPFRIVPDPQSNQLPGLQLFPFRIPADLIESIAVPFRI